MRKSLLKESSANAVRLFEKRLSFLKPGCTRCFPQYDPKPLGLRKRIRVNTKNENLPKISMVIPTLNQASFLERAIKSIIDQQYPRLELILVDGGSTDGSREIIEKYAGHFAWWVSEADKGQAEALNKGFFHSGGEILGWLNSDDCFAPGALWTVAACFLDSPDADVIYGQRVLINEKGDDIGRWILPQHDDKILSWADFIPQETVFWRRSIWEEVGERLDEEFRFALDWDLLLRFREAGAKMKRVPHYLGLFRIHEEQKTHKDMEVSGRGEMERLWARSLGYVPRRERVIAAAGWYLMKARILEWLCSAGMVRYD